MRKSKKNSTEIILIGWHGAINFKHPASVGGIIVKTCEILATKGFRFSIFCDKLNILPNSKEATKQHRSPLIYTYRVPSFLRIFGRKIYSWLKIIWISFNLSLRKGSIVHIYVNPLIVILCRCLFLRKKILFSVHSPPHTWGYGKMKLALKKANMVQVPSIFIKQELNRLFPFTEHKTKVVYNGVDTLLFEPCIKRKKVFSIFFAGNLWKVKGIHLLVKVANMLPERNVKVEIAGGFYPQSDKFHTYLKRISSENVNYLGMLNHKELAKYFANADITVVPSLWREPFGMVIIESMACGTPVIGSHIGGIPELIDDGIDGFLIEPGSVGELKEKIVWCNEHPKRLTEMRKKAREKALKFDWSIISEKLKEVYFKLLETPRSCENSFE